jgi:acyl-CoA dehydrogenase
MSEMRDDLLNTVDRLCTEHCDKALRESAETSAWPGGLWQALEEVGLTKAALPAEAGGSGLAFDDAMLALRRSAYHAVPVPLAETMLAGRLLVAAGLKVPEGAITVAPVTHDDRLAIAQGAGGPVLTGDARRVPWGNQCPHAVVVAELGGREMVGVVSTANATAGVEKNLAGEPRALLRFNAAPVVAMAALDGAAARLMAEGALLRSVQMAGALERALEYTLLYANERVQFGRPIGKFQAIQHLLAVLAGHTAAASAAADAAVEASQIAPDAFAVAVAKSRTGEAAGKGAEIAHQVHGAMGYTREHNLHWPHGRERRCGRAVAAADRGLITSA